MRARLAHLCGLTLLLGLLTLLSARAQPLRYPNLVGVVHTRATSGQNPATASYNYEGLAGVEVMVLEGDRVQAQSTTDEKGWFQFENIPQGTYRIRCSKPGYPSIDSKPVRVSKGGQLSPQQILMTPTGVTMQGDVAVGPGSVCVAFAADPSKEPKDSTNLNWKQRVQQWMFDDGGHRPKSFPRDADIPTCWDPNFLMNMAPDAHAADYTPLDSGPQPNWICFAGAKNELYAARSNLVSVLGGPTGETLLANLALPGAITELCASTDRRFVLAGLMANPCRVIVIDAGTRQISATLPCPGPPAALLPLGGVVYVALREGAQGLVYKLDQASGRALGRAQVGVAPTGLALLGDGRRLLCVNSGSASLTVLDADTLAEIQRVPVGVTPQKVVVTPDGKRVFISNRGSASVSLLDGSTLATLATTVVPRGPVGMAVNKEGTRVFVACVESGRLAVLDGISGQMLHLTPPQPRSQPWGVAVHP